MHSHKDLPAEHASYKDLHVKSALWSPATLSHELKHTFAALHLQKMI